MEASTRAGASWFFAWAAVGAGHVLEVLSILSIGVLLPVVAGLAWFAVGARRRAA